MNKKQNTDQNRQPRLPMLLAVGATMVMATMTSTGCVDTDGQMFIRHSTPLSAASAPDCTLNQTNLVQLGGTLDLSGVGATYSNMLVVAVNLPANITTTTLNESREQSPSYPNNYGTGETAVVLFDSAEVFLTDAEGEEFNGVPGPNNPRMIDLGGSVQNIQGTLATNTILPVQTILPEDAVAIRASGPENGALEVNQDARSTVIVNARVNARTSGGGFLRTQNYAFPISVCVGCLLAIGGEGGQCQGGQADPVPVANQNICVPAGQDVPFGECP